jgi:murein DD-endopeptidase MepM/ murein hydrolase activator NlpD
MTTRTRRRGNIVAALVVCFFAGAVSGWWLGVKGAPRPVSSLDSDLSVVDSSSSRTIVGAEPPVATTGEPRVAAAPHGSEPGGAIDDLRQRDLRLPIEGANLETFKGEFDERRGGGDRPHEAVDILAPRNTPVHAVEDGTIAKLFFSKAGGITIYQFDPSSRFCYYYAHLERYADGLKDGQRVSRGDVIGYVGTTCNAPPGTPHLHFAVFELTAQRHWWQGQALDPYLVYKRSG